MMGVLKLASLFVVHVGDADAREIEIEMIDKMVSSIRMNRS